MYLVAEYCSASFYMGWWLYERDTNDGKRNADGEWGWLRRSDSWSQQGRIRDLLCSMGYAPPACRDHSQALAEWFAATFPNGLRVEREETGGCYRLVEIVKSRPKQRRHSIRTIRGAALADIARHRWKVAEKLKKQNG